MRRGVLAALTILVMLSAPASHAAAKLLRVVIKDVAYQNVPATAHVGDTLEFINQDIFDHTATARDGSFDLRLPAGKTGRTVLKKAGKVAFYCRLHPNMKGEVDVEP